MVGIDYSGFASPKPVRPAKERTPLRRNTPLRTTGSRSTPKRMTIDPAAFRPKEIEAVWGPTPLCVQTAQPSKIDMPVDFQHIMGRGEALGFKGEYCAICSSIFNGVPLRRDIHEGPLRDAPDQRAVYLRVACTRVLNAMASGKLTLSDDDRAFVYFIRSYPEYAGIYEGIPLD